MIHILQKYLTAIFVLLVLASPFCSCAAEWSQLTSHLKTSSVAVKHGAYEEVLTMRTPFIHGGDIILVKSVENSRALTVYFRYRFMGIEGGSMHIVQSGAVQKANDTVSTNDSSFDETFLVEASPDGVFYFVPSSLQDVAYLRIERDKAHPGQYKSAIIPVDH